MDNLSEQYKMKQEKKAYYTQVNPGYAEQCDTAKTCRPFTILEEMKMRRTKTIESLNTLQTMIEFLEASEHNQKIAEMLRRAI